MQGFSRHKICCPSSRAVSWQPITFLVAKTEIKTPRRPLGHGCDSGPLPATSAALTKAPSSSPPWSSNHSLGYDRPTSAAPQLPWPCPNPVSRACGTRCSSTTLLHRSLLPQLPSTAFYLLSELVLMLLLLCKLDLCSCAHTSPRNKKKKWMALGRTTRSPPLLCYHQLATPTDPGVSCTQF